MTLSLTSTVPGAVSTLRDHFQAVASASALDPGVYLGTPTAEVANNYLMIGEYASQQIVHGYSSSFAAIPGAAALKSEDYRLACTIRAWSGDVDELGRIDDAYGLFDAVVSALTADLGGSGQLTPSGSWQVTNAAEDDNGPLAFGAGWGYVLGFDVHVFNVQLSTPRL